MPDTWQSTRELGAYEARADGEAFGLLTDVGKIILGGIHPVHPVQRPFGGALEKDHLETGKLLEDTSGIRPTSACVQLVGAPQDMHGEEVIKTLRDETEIAVGVAYFYQTMQLGIVARGAPPERLR